MNEVKNVTETDFEHFKASLQNNCLTGNEPGLLEALTDWIMEKNQREFQLYGLADDGNILGVISCSLENDLNAEIGFYTLIGMIFVHPDHRKRGVGKRLVHFIQNHATTAWIVVSPADEQAAAFFTECGFVPLEHRDIVGEYLMFSKGRNT